MILLMAVGSIHAADNLSSEAIAVFDDDLDDSDDEDG